MALKHKSSRAKNLDDNKVTRLSLKSNKNAKAKRKKPKTPKKTSKIVKNKSKSKRLFDDSSLPFHGFCYTKGSYACRRNLHLSERETGRRYYVLTGRLDPLPFLYDQPEGMPCWIQKLDDIVNMSKENVLVFLRGYGECTDDAVLDELRRRLAIAVGVHEPTANRIFNYDNEFWKSLANDESDGELFVDFNLPCHDFCYTGGSYACRRNLHLSERDTNRSFFVSTGSLDPLPFLYDQPEGMPCWIQKLDDIVNMSKENVLVFLRGYGESTDDADLDELRRRLAIAVGVHELTANKVFNYDNEFWKSLANDESDGEELFVDSNLPCHDFYYPGGSYACRRNLHLSERKTNRTFFLETNRLDPLPFLYDPPEGMPCWIRKLDDIVNMSKENVLVFLRGYGESTDDADLDELRRRLAIAVGVPEETANDRFNFVDSSSGSDDEGDEQVMDDETTARLIPISI